MALVVKDRVQETTTTEGTGTLTLNGAVTGFQTFSSAIGNSNTTYYAISSSGSEFEVGIGTVGAGTLARTTILASSNGGSVVTLSAGTKNVFCTQPAEKSLYLDASGNTISLGILTSPKIGTSILDTNGNELALLTATASAVNELTIANSATGNGPEISATGSDTNIDLKLTPKGTGKLNLDGIKFPNADGSAGQALVTNGSGILSFASAGLAWQSVKTADFTAVKGEAYPINTTSTAITVTLPATPSAGDQVQVVDYAGTADTNKIIISPNGNKIEGFVVSFELTGDREGVILTYIDSTQGWIATSGINEGTDALTPILTADFLVVAGGAGGGGTTLNVGAVGGGGGAGGYRSFTSQTLAVATNYTVTVGGGGAGGAQLNNSDGSAGSNSVFSIPIASGGGGGGGGNQSASANVGVAGGSGGGGGGGAPGANGGAGNTPSTSPSQGNNGANTPGAGTGGGGGGSNAAGSGSTGGSGTASSITGSSVTRAAGGSGGTGSGQGVIPTAKGANTGNGGDGGFGAGGGAGGSGIVIIKYPDAFTITNPGGGLTSSTSSAGGFKVTSFTAGTGTIQFN